MFYNAKSCQMMIGSNTVNYIEFGSGKKTLIILPGLGDGLFPLHGKYRRLLLLLDISNLQKIIRFMYLVEKIKLQKNIPQGIWLKTKQI